MLYVSLSEPGLLVTVGSLAVQLDYLSVVRELECNGLCL